VAGDIDEAKPQRPPLSGGELKVSKPDIDRDAAALFFFPAIGVDAGKSFDQSGLAVVNVAGCAYDDRFHP
jgi:hypothetical protein